MAAWAQAPLPTRERHEHLMAAVRAADAGKTEMQVAATKESAAHHSNQCSPTTIAAFVAFVVGVLKLRVVALDEPVQLRCARTTRMINRRQLARHDGH
jgi:hypothetical protein